MAILDPLAEDQRNRIAALLATQDIAEHAPIDIFPHSPAAGDQLALSQRSDPNSNPLDPDGPVGPIGAAPPGGGYQAPSLQDMIDALQGSRTPSSKGEPDEGDPDAAGKDQGPLGPGGMFGPGFQSSFASLHDPGDPLGGGVPGYSLADQPGEVPGPPDAFGGDKGIPVDDDAGKGYPGEGTPNMPAPSTPSDWSDFASMTPSATAAFAAGFDAGAASVSGTGDTAGQGDTSGSGSSASSSSGDPGGSPGGVG